jgi:two-component system, cell cycle sensor histidine kinase and response regulator CckA
VESGDYVEVSVSDSGHGIEESAISRIFEPFFTTKRAGEGTGLGLAMVYGFVKQSGGHVEVESEPGRGTTFRLFLPHGDARGGDAAPSAELGTPAGGTETVLLVEDEEAIRRLMSRTLRSNGYTVLEASDGLEAIQLARRHCGGIELLLTDLVMPRMNGLDLAELLSEACPDVRTLFISGYSEEAVTRHGATRENINLLPKPFGPLELIRSVREVLDRTG